MPNPGDTKMNRALGDLESNVETDYKGSYKGMGRSNGRGAVGNRGVPTQTGTWRWWEEI